MSDFPLLPLPEAFRGDPPDSKRPPPRPPMPSPQRQGERLGHRFERLRRLSETQGALSLREDPSGIAPERALVFEVAGQIRDIFDAIRAIEGLDFLGDEAIDFGPDKDFFTIDTRKRTKGQPRMDRPVEGRLYLAMPDVTALRHLLSLWDGWQKTNTVERPFGRWKKVFEQLHDLRAWGPKDRLSDDTVRVWREELEESPQEMRRIEVELWFTTNETARRRTLDGFRAAVDEAGGSVVHEATIDEIRYSAALVDIPAREINRISAREEVHLLTCDGIMFLRPQSSLDMPEPIDPEDEADGRRSPTASPSDLPPIAALLDGVPVQNHTLLRGRIAMEDPDDLETMSVVSRRHHGTAMASLIIHGDRELDQDPIARRLLVRPVLCARDGTPRETVPSDRLALDVIYRAVLRMKEGEGEDNGTAPDVFLINLSLGDRHRPFAGLLSPWARLLDYLADRYNLLFLVSAGNIVRTLPISEFPDWISFKDAAPGDRERAVLKALHAERPHRTLLSPAEAINVITVGAVHQDAWPRHRGAAVDPYNADDLPNISSAHGLGHRRAIKPDIHMPGGREFVYWSGSPPFAIQPAPGLFGLRAAAPPQSSGSPDREGWSNGTSVAAALATRACHRIFDSLMDTSGGSLLSDLHPRFRAVVVKSLLVHRAKWQAAADLVGALVPRGVGKHFERSDNIARFLGYGAPRIEEAITCAENRATLVGYGEIGAKQTNVHQIPLPESLEQVTDPRSLTITVAWISPTNPNRQEYRQAELAVGTAKGIETGLGVSRTTHQPNHHACARGTVFHCRYEGSGAVSFLHDGRLSLPIVCRERGGSLDRSIRYGVVVTIEAGEGVPVYREVRTRLAALVGAPTSS